MFYGKETRVSIVDNNGSTVSKEVNYIKNQPNLPVRVTYDNRVKVSNQTQEFEEYKKFSDDIQRDPKKLDPRFSIERSSLGEKNGFYYVVASYTLLEYQA